MLVTIGNPPVMVDYKDGSLKIEMGINFKSSGSFVVEHEPLEWWAEESQPVSIAREGAGAPFWTGFVHAVDEKLIGEGLLQTTITLKDNHYLVAKRKIIKVFEGVYAEDIVTWMLTNILGAEGITAGTIEQGAFFSRIAFNTSCDKALDQLAERCGFAFRIDHLRQLHFHARSTFVAPRSLTWDDIKEQTLVVNRSSQNYRNRQYVRGASDITRRLEARFPTDGKTSSWTVGFPLVEEPTVQFGPDEDNLSSGTIGIKGVESGKDFYWNLGESTITQDSDGESLGSAEVPGVILITFRGRYPVTCQEDDIDAQAARAALEGVGTGIVEDFRDDAGQTSRVAAQELGVALLERYTQPAVTASFQTETYEELIPGQLLPMLLEEHRLDEEDGEFLVTEISIREVASGEDPDDYLIVWSVSTIDGPEGDTWQRWFQRREAVLDQVDLMAHGGDQAIIRRFGPYTKTWQLSDLPRIFESPLPGVLPDDLYPALEDEDKVRYLSWHDADGDELGRSQVVALEAEPASIYSIAFINQTEGNGTIYFLRWWGDPSATATPGTGLLIDSQAVNITKTSGEVLQIDREDVKGY